MYSSIENVEEKTSLLRERVAITRPKMSSSCRKKMTRLLIDVAKFKIKDSENSFICLRLNDLLNSKPYFLTYIRYGGINRKIKHWIYQIMEKSTTLSSYLEKKELTMGDFSSKSRWEHRLLLIDVLLAELKK